MNERKLLVVDRPIRSRHHLNSMPHSSIPPLAFLTAWTWWYSESYSFTQHTRPQYCSINHPLNDCHPYQPQLLIRTIEQKQHLVLLQGIKFPSQWIRTPHSIICFFLVSFHMPSPPSDPSHPTSPIPIPILISIQTFNICF